MIGVFLLSRNWFGAGLEVLQGLQLLFMKVKWPFTMEAMEGVQRKAWRRPRVWGAFQPKAQSGSVFSPFPSYSASRGWLCPLRHSFS